MKMKVADYIAAYLHAQGVTHVYEVVGGMITHLLDAIHQQDKIRIISMHHEQGASFAVDGMARITGIPAIAMATSGPGATNLLTGIGSCHFDSVPAVFITGQVNRHEQKKDRAIRQLGFQETEIVPMAKHITKAAWQVENPEDIPGILEMAFRTALEGRRGPVLIDIPMDVQRIEIEVPEPCRVTPQAQGSPDLESIDALLTRLNQAKRPLFLLGGGVPSTHLTQKTIELLERIQAPAVHSLMAVDVLPYGHPLRAGLIGSYGNRWANHALGDCDFLVVLGSRLDVRQTGADTQGFKQGKTIYHIDCEIGEINNRVIGCQVIHAELAAFLELALQKAEDKEFSPWQDWKDKITKLRQEWPDTDELKDTIGINPNRFMHQLSRMAQSASAYSVDVGQHQMWAAQSLELSSGQRFITSGGMGAMGFSLPAAIGAAFARPQQPVVVIAGDGSFQMNIQELQTIARNHLPIKIIILDNQCHGMVRQFQESYFDSRYQSTYWGYSAPNFAAIATAYGIDSSSIESGEDITVALQALWEDPTRPYLLQVKIDTFANAYPKMAFGRPISEMEPFAKPVAMEST